jgi:hypothetical protein
MPGDLFSFKAVRHEFGVRVSQVSGWSLGGVSGPPASVGGMRIAGFSDVLPMGTNEHPRIRPPGEGDGGASAPFD